MRESKSFGEEGYVYRHFTDDNYFALKEFQRQYEAMAYRTWFDLIDTCNPKWVLTVETIKI